MDEHVAPPSFAVPVQEAVFWRGVFLHHYGIIEFAVSELLLRAAYHADYKAFGKVPSKWRERFERLGRILDAPGPLGAYSEVCRRLVSQITIVEDDRHILAHARMRVREVAGSSLVHLEWHDVYNKRMKENDLPLADLRCLAQELGAAACALTTLIDEMMDAAGILPIPLEPAESNQRRTRTI